MKTMSLLLSVAFLWVVYSPPPEANQGVVIIENAAKLNPVTTTNNTITNFPDIYTTPEPTVIPTPITTTSSKLLVEPNPKWSKDQIITRINEVFGSNADKAIKIAQCESGIRDNAIGDRGLNPSSYGIFQIRAFANRGTPQQLLDPEYNIQYAFKMSGGGNNWNAWTCSRKVGL